MNLEELKYETAKLKNYCRQLMRQSPNDEETIAFVAKSMAKVRFNEAIIERTTMPEEAAA